MLTGRHVSGREGDENGGAESDDGVHVGGTVDVSVGWLN